MESNDDVQMSVIENTVDDSEVTPVVMNEDFGIYIITSHL